DLDYALLRPRDVQHPPPQGAEGGCGDRGAMSHSMEPEHRPAPPGPHGDGDLGFDLPPPARISGARAAAFVLVGVAILSAAFVLGWLPKKRARQELEAAMTSESGGLLRVAVVTPKVLSSDRAMVLPGSLRPLEEAS